MSIGKIKQKLSGGFIPFLILTSDGKTYEIPHPEFILLGKYHVAVTDEEGDIVVIDPLHVVALKDIGKRKTFPKA
jgi:hypothetical protein